MAQATTTSTMTSTATATQAPICDDFSKWPNVDNGVTCGSCKALVEAEKFGNVCARYCESFGHKCAAAQEELSESCGVAEEGSCDTPIAPDSSDILCTCTRTGELPQQAVTPDPSFKTKSTTCKGEDARLVLGADNGVTFRCLGAACVSMKGRCNGVANCGDESDEKGCEVPTTRTSTTTQEVVQISGSWTLGLKQGTNLDAFVCDSTVKNVMAATVATITGVSPKNIEVSLFVLGGRRLQVEAIQIEAAGSGGRRLAASVLVAYLVTVVQKDATSVQNKLAAAVAEKVTTELAKQMAAKGLGAYIVVVTGVTAPVVTGETVPTSATTTTAKGPTAPVALGTGKEIAASGTIVAAVLGAIVICCLGSGCAIYAAMKNHRKKTRQAKEAEEAVQAVGAVEAMGAKDVATNVQAVQAAVEADVVSGDAEAKDENSDDERFFSL
mmetsp:Transcript_116388/g.370248  ORF Transcript_116388/g.370248 Transcript_116388/m.370248 type:complete len:441 (-) Transcript_116388:175-1497(-)